MNRAKKLRYPLLILAVVLLMMGIFSLSYRYDNKYTHQSPQAIGGVLFLDCGELAASPYLFLVNGWEYYDGVLLTPADAAVSQPTETIAIGQYGGMETDKTGASPHGSATYGMTLVLPEESAQYTLGLPEIFSAYHLYVNDELLVSRGDPAPDHYRPEVQSGFLTFTAAGETTLLIAVSDYSHFYSGMVYPPVFGQPEAVITLLGGRLIFCGLMCCIAFCFALFELCIAIGQKEERRRHALYAAICLCAIGILGYPLIYRLVATRSNLWYAAEFFCRYAIFALLCMLINNLCDVATAAKRISNVVDVVVCAGMSLASFFAPVMSVSAMQFFSVTAKGYQWCCAAWMLITAAVAVRYKKDFSKPILCGVVVFAISLPAERLFPLFEPIRFGWFTELSVILMVLILGSVLWSQILSSYRDNAILQAEAEQMNTQLAMQKEHYESFAHQVEDLRQFRHDQRHHLDVISGLVADQNYTDLAGYLEQQRSAFVLTSDISFCSIYSLDVLLRHYYTLAKSQNIRVAFDMKLPEKMQIPDAELCVVFANLLENAVEACRDVPLNLKALRLNVRMVNSIMRFEMENSYNGEPLTPDGELFLSTKERGRKGIGLRSVRAIVEKYNGDLAVQAKPDGDNSLFITQFFLGWT